MMNENSPLREKRQLSAAPVYHWRRAADEDVEQWNERLLSTTASLYQYPYWNEPLRRMGFSTVYLTCFADDRPCGYVAILVVGAPVFRIGLIDQGPICLDGDEFTDLEALRALERWAAGEGFAFLRFAHMSQTALDAVASLEGALTTDAFPLYRYRSSALLVSLSGAEDDILASFQQIARRDIRSALAAGYEIRASRSVADFAEAWPLFEALYRRKGLRQNRSLTAWSEVVDRAAKHDLFRLYTARLAEEIVEAVAVFRDGATAEYVLGALSLDALGDRPSPTCLVHWRAMRDARAAGCNWYDLGARTSDAVYVFKRKFRPLERNAPPTVTLVTNAFAYAIWSNLFLRVLLPIWPRVRSLLAWARSR
jgi:hypothetical protein